MQQYLLLSEHAGAFGRQIRVSVRVAYPQETVAADLV